MVVPIPPEAQAADALTLVLAAAGHPLQGDMALYRGTVAVGSPTQLQDKSLYSQAQDQSWRRSWALFLDRGAPAPGADNTGQERFVQNVDLANGMLRWQPPLPTGPQPGDRFVLFRDYRFGQWLQWLNETARNIHYPLDVYVPQVEGALRYSLPDPVEREGWLMDVLIGPAGATYTSPEGRGVRWHRVNPVNVEGDLYLVLSRPLAASQQLLFRAKPPFAYEHETPYSMLTSVLYPAGRPAGPAIRPPVRLFILGVVWRSLQQKAVNLTGQPRQLWQQNLERAARQYAQACAEWGVREVGRDLGYSEDWYPWNTSSWTAP